MIDRQTRSNPSNPSPERSRATVDGASRPGRANWANSCGKVAGDDVCTQGRVITPVKKLPFGRRL